MKYAKPIFFIILFIQLAGRLLFAQSSPILGRFFVSESEGTVLLNWSIVAGSTCDGIKIYRSVDSIHFSLVGEILGLCGSVGFEQQYDFTDNNPVKNKVNYYRLELGNQGFSKIVSIKIIDIENSGYLIRPHPANAQAEICFNNYSGQKAELSIFNFNGQKIASAATQDSYFVINTSEMNSGLYIFTIFISETSNQIKGELLIQH